MCHGMGWITGDAGSRGGSQQCGLGRCAAGPVKVLGSQVEQVFHAEWQPDGIESKQFEAAGDRHDVPRELCIAKPDACNPERNPERLPIQN